MKNIQNKRNINLTVLFKFIFTSLAVISLTNSWLFAQNSRNELNVITNNWLLYSDAPNSLYNYITDQAYDLLEKRTNK